MQALNMMNSWCVLLWFSTDFTVGVVHGRVPWVVQKRDAKEENKETRKRGKVGKERKKS